MRWTGNLWEKSKYHMHDKGLLSKTCKKLTLHSSKWKQSQQDKQTKNRDQHLKRRPMYLGWQGRVQRCMNVCLALPIIRERPIQEWSPGIVAVAERSWCNVGEDVEKWGSGLGTLQVLIHTVLLKVFWSFTQKVKSRTLFKMSSLNYCPKEIKSSFCWVTIATV